MVIVKDWVSNLYPENSISILSNFNVIGKEVISIDGEDASVVAGEIGAQLADNVIIKHKIIWRSDDDFINDIILLV